MQYFNLSLLLTLNFTPFLSVSFEYMDVCRVLHSTLMNDDIIKTIKEKQQPKIARIKGLPVDDFHYYEAILLTLREKCPYSEFSGPYSVRMWVNTDQKKLRIQKLFTQWRYNILPTFPRNTY